ncbi:MAG: hypothetical protein D6762_03005 [Candidatus Neomarinimicrobiota bacterium]|nr:MAG: hypothetical protein D6762_03005 [Candidatus Neomarinimicrobiota bacterium]
MHGWGAVHTSVRLLSHLMGPDPAGGGIVRTEYYPGPGGSTLPVKQFLPARPRPELLLLFHGASPYGENHPALDQMARAAAAAGITVYIPRIPPLMRLEIRPDLDGWIEQGYAWARSRVSPDTSVRIMGVSFGGPLVLKALSSGSLRDDPPEAVLLYGSYFDIDSILDYLCSGQMNFLGRHWVQPVNEWGLVVFFHNYLDRIDPGYSVRGLRQVLALRVADEVEASRACAARLQGREKAVAEGLLQGKANAEIRRLTRLIREAAEKEFRALSPRTFAHRVRQPVFLIHGQADTMVPFTESVRLASALPRSRLLVTRLYEHSEMKSGGARLQAGWEGMKILFFLTRFFEATA